MAPSFSGVWKLQTKYQYSSAFPIDLNLGDLGLYAGGTTGSAYVAEVDKLTLAGNSNATDFGDLSTNRQAMGSASSDTRMLVGGGFYTDGGGSDVQVNIIEYFTYATASNSTDFGDLSATKYLLNGLSNNIRGIFHGGSSGGSTINVIEYVTIASTGNATDFGDLSGTYSNHGYGICASTTRGIISGFNSNVIEYLTIPSTGNTRDFGDMTVTRKQGHAQMASATRGVFAGGRDNSNNRLNVIDYIGLASLGNATDFGDIATAKFGTMGMSSLTKGFIAGGTTSSGYENVIEQITIATTGNATDFGDLTQAKGVGNGASNGQAAFQSLSALPSSGNTGLYTYAVDSFIQSIDIASLGNGVAFGDISYTYVNGTYGAASSSTRCCFAGGSFGGGRQPNIDLSIFATRGLGTDFGDLTTSRQTTGGSNSTRGMYVGGQPSGYTNVVDYTTIASASNATDFGDLSENVGFPAVSGNTTRLLSLGGRTSGYRNVIEYFTISSTGDATDFGDLTQNVGFGAATSSSTRVVNCGGFTGSSYTNVIDYVTTASTGNATDFGDLTVAIGQGGCFGNKTTAIWAGGYVGDGSSTVSTMMNFTIASTGNASNFGDLVASAYTTGAAQSNGHGGIS